ncbi:MAG: mechanosensitive ion channel family protein [Nitrospinota bacterium]|nr:mechanosensitive ion channel family protein [Nitrospinota bacterium]MDH5678531.1 mechanosensitive ion channel family protein [Nitrospinota bacterium]MDH5756661.1 mechanosensitive ion channel family protein [Nitrospinota bacterium]
MEEISQVASTYLPRIAGGLALILLFWVMALIARTMSHRILSTVGGTEYISKLISSTCYYVIILIGLLTGLDTMGVRMGPIIASLGLGGFALGFALKDVISNLLAGVLILVHRPFKEGDYLVVSGCEGRVTEINMRYTILSGEDTTYMIPNASIFTNPLQLKNPQ